MPGENNQAENNNPLQDFTWDDDVTFFNIPKEEEVSETEQVIKKVKADDDFDELEIEEDIEEEETPTKSKGNKKPKVEKDEEVEEEFFSEVDETEEDFESSTTDTDKDFYTTLTKELKEKGVFQNIEIEEGEEVDLDKFFELQDAEIDARVEETFEAFAEELDEDAKAFLQFKKNGGNTQDFFKVYGSQSSLNIDSIDTENETDQDLVIKHYLKSVEAMDDEEIQDKLDWLEEVGKKKTYSEKYKTKLKQIDGANKQNLQQQVERVKKEREDASKAFNQELQEALDKTESVGSFSFDKVDKKDLMSYIIKPSVKVGKNNFITQFQADLGEIFKAKGEKKQNLLLLAKLVKTGFDVKDLIASAKTKVVKETRSNLQKAKAGVKASSTGGNRKSIVDYF